MHRLQGPWSCSGLQNSEDPVTSDTLTTSSTNVSQASPFVTLDRLVKVFRTRSSTSLVPGHLSSWFSSLARIWGKCSTFHSRPALFSFLFFFFFLEVGIRSRTVIPLFMPGSVPSGWASWDDCGRVFPDKLRVSSFSLTFWTHWFHFKLIVRPGQPQR